MRACVLLGLFCCSPFEMIRCQFLGCGDIFSKPFLDALSGWNLLAKPGEVADVAVIASHGRILRREELQQFKRGVINMHPSLLPLYRGAAPAEWQILRGERISGVTAILTTAQIDAGPVLAQESFALPDDVTRDELLRRAAARGVPMLHRLLSDWETAIKSAVPQRGATSSAPKVTRALARVSWSSWSAQEADRRARALSERFGGLETSWNGKLVRLGGALRCVESDARREGVRLRPGEASWKPGCADLCIGLADGTWLSTTRLTVSGGKEMSAPDFARGYWNKNPGLPFV